MPTPVANLDALFGRTYANRRVLVTGHTGFKGSWLALWLQAMGARVSAFSLGPDTSPSHSELLGGVEDAIPCDLRDPRAVQAALARFAPEIVFHLGAQSLVKRGYAQPRETFDVNVMGLVHLLDAVRDTPSVRAVVVVTTDKCYQNEGHAVPFGERDPLGGHDPYSASKACAEIVTACYRSSYFPKVALASARAGNVVGGGDWAADRLVPDLMRAAARGARTPIRSPRAVRPWQHVLEPLSGYLRLGELLLSGGGDATMGSGAWNFGPEADGHLCVDEVADALAAHWPAVRIDHDARLHPHEAPALRLDCRRARALLGWQPVWNSAAMLARTALWYRAWYERGEVRTHQDLMAYVADASQLGLPWTGANVPALAEVS